MSKIRVAVLFGGVSPEHEISLLSAQNIIRALDPEKYEVIKIGIDKTGKWQLHKEAEYLLNSADAKKISLINSPHKLALECGDEKNAILEIGSQKGIGKIDVCFPIIHGGAGENGGIQGLFEILDVAFVGPDLQTSAVCFDKDLAKRLLKLEGIPVAEGITLFKNENYNLKEIEGKFGFPLFIKPSRTGSSVGVSKAKNISELEKAIIEAFQFDEKVLVETAIVGREIECAVLGNRENLRASTPAEIIPSGGHEFYDYDAKYCDENGARIESPANISEEEKEKVQKTAIAVAKTLEIEGMSRIDGFLTADGNFIINEINTIPGFTNISMYPKMWEISGIPQNELIDELIQLAMERKNRK